MSVEEKLNQAKGAIKEGFGKVTGDKKILPGQTIAKTENHSWDAGKVTTKATCTEEGEKTFTCSICGDKKTEKEGAAEKAVSKVKEVAEDAKDAVEGAIEGVKNMIKKDDK